MGEERECLRIVLVNDILQFYHLKLNNVVTKTNKIWKSNHSFYAIF